MFPAVTVFSKKVNNEIKEKLEAEGIQCFPQNGEGITAINRPGSGFHSR